MQSFLTKNGLLKYILLERRVPILAIVLDILEYRAIISRMIPLKNSPSVTLSFVHTQYALLRQTIPYRGGSRNLNESEVRVFTNFFEKERLSYL